MTKKKLLCITGAVVFSAGIIAAAVFLLPNTAAPVVSTQSYEQLMANGGIDIGYKILDVKKVNPRFGQADGYAFIIDYNDRQRPSKSTRLRIAHTRLEIISPVRICLTEPNR